MTEHYLVMANGLELMSWFSGILSVLSGGKLYDHTFWSLELYLHRGLVSAAEKFRKCKTLVK